MTSSVVGQLVIPIPFLGAAIGGVVGGALGTAVGTLIDKNHSRERILYSDLIKSLIEQRVENGLWTFEDLSISNQQIMARWMALVKTDKQGSKNWSDNDWLTIICFVNISLYHAVVKNNLQEELGQKFVSLVPEDFSEDSQIRDKQVYLYFINQFLEKTIEHVAGFCSLVEHQSSLMKIIQILKVLNKEGYLSIDIKLSK